MSATREFELVLALMAAVLLLQRVSRKLHLPPSAALVLGGIGLALIPGMPDMSLDPDLTLVLFLPPLLFASAYFTVWRDFRANLRIILQLAVGAVVFTTLFVGVVAHLIVPSLPWAACFALGAVISPPDAVAAKAALEGVPLPPRINTLLEGESLVNDATGLVLFRFAVAAGLTGAFDAGDAVARFAVLAVGGTLAGVFFGYVVAFLLAHLQQARLNIVGSFLAAWASYICGDALHVSGVLATVSCGLMTGWRQHDVFSAQTRTQGHAVWDVAVFILESMVFILIGLSLRGVLSRLTAAGLTVSALAPSIGIIAVAMVASRFLWIFPAAYVPRFLFPGLRRLDPYPSVAALTILSWAGMRGVVSLAVALAVPIGFPGRDFILATTLAVIFISILIQGTTLPFLVRLWGPGQFRLDQESLSLSEAAARVELARAALEAVKHHSMRADGSHRHPRLVEQYSHRAAMAERFAHSHGELDTPRAEHFSTVLAANRAARAHALVLHRSGRIHDAVLHALEAELDLEEITVQRALNEPMLEPDGAAPKEQSGDD